MNFRPYYVGPFMRPLQLPEGPELRQIEIFPVLNDHPVMSDTRSVQKSGRTSTVPLRLLASFVRLRLLGASYRSGSTASLKL